MSYFNAGTGDFLDTPPVVQGMSRGIGPKDMERICRGGMLRLKWLTLALSGLALALILIAFITMRDEEKDASKALLNSASAVMLALTLVVIMDVWFGRSSYFRKDGPVAAALAVAVGLVAVAFMTQDTMDIGWTFGMLTLALAVLLWVRSYGVRIPDALIVETPRLPGYLGSNGYAQFIRNIDSAIDKAIFHNKVQMARVEDPRTNEFYAQAKDAMQAALQLRTADEKVAGSAVGNYLLAANQLLALLLTQPGSDVTAPRVGSDQPVPIIAQETSALAKQLWSRV